MLCGARTLLLHLVHCWRRGRSASTSAGATHGSGAGCVTAEVESLSDAWSRGTEPTETNLEAELSKQADTAEPGVDELLASLGMAFSAEPLLPPPRKALPVGTGTQPPPYRNLFWRRYKQSGRLTAELLKQQTKESELVALPTGTGARPMNDGEWLWHFKAVARSVPIRCVAASILGEDLGSDLACFVGLEAFDASSERHGGTVDADDPPNGERVIGSRYVPTMAMMGKGRAGFALADEVSISTPGRTSSLRSYRTSSDAESEASEADLGAFHEAA
mmetsp:Transcript_99518/g.276973  ORF Transcript_99518/g.276973 Transcript_99518/m.276973 type:complete len:276 (-) Transcript_99518:209-1036(-)